MFLDQSINHDEEGVISFLMNHKEETASQQENHNNTNLPPNQRMKLPPRFQKKPRCKPFPEMDLSAGADIQNGNQFAEGSSDAKKRRVAYYYDRSGLETGRNG